MHATGKDECGRCHDFAFGFGGESEVGFGSLAGMSFGIGILVPVRTKLGLQVMEVEIFLWGMKNKDPSVLGLGAVEFSFPQIYEIFCISPIPPVKKEPFPS